MFQIRVHNSAPEQMKNVDYWCRFLIGTHWRKFNDNAELVITDARGYSYGEIKCNCKAFNNTYSIGGSKVRDFPIGDSYLGNWVDIEEMAKHGFNLVPDTIMYKRYDRLNDPYIKKMNNLGWGDYESRRAGSDYSLKGMTNGRNDEPIALFSHGIPVGRVVSLKGLVIGNESGIDYSYSPIR